ncbi:MAG: LacI family DNA-binding transcriptional regulator [Rhodothermales bacterium]
MSNRVRLIDIAKELNLTKVAVSKALRDHPDISKNTRELVKQTAEKMGYTPNLLARSLSSQRSNILGVVVPKIAHTFFSSVIEAIQAEATTRGYGIILAVSNENASLERAHIERLLDMRVDGLLVSATQQKPDLKGYQRIRDLKIPLVFFDRKVDGMDFNSVTVDDRNGAFNSVDFLISKGYKKIAHIAGTSTLQIGRERQLGFRLAMQKNGLHVPESWIIEGGYNEQHGYDAFLKIIESKEIPEAIFAVTFPVGLGIRGAIREHMPELLDRIAILTFGDGGLNEFYMYPHFCVRQPTQEMGQQAVEIVLAEINATGPPPTREVILDTRLVTPKDFRLPGVDDLIPR